MKTYIVGGAVRDRILGLPVVDRDHVVVGASVDEMIAAGYRPVGRDFPVFLHPETHEEYALARTERKVAPGYAGFVFHADRSVTLAADLARRDLTINAMALDEATGEVIDPFGGRRDLAARLLRHVGPAFVEDPVRILRVARFAARFADFTVADETRALMRSMVSAGEVDALVPERVWQEVARGLMEATPSRLVRVLRDAGALARLFPELDAVFGLEAGRATLAALDRAAAATAPIEVRFAVLVHGVSGNAVERVSERWAIPRATRDVAALVVREGAELVRLADSADADALVRVFERCDAIRRGPRFALVTAAVAITAPESGAIEARLMRGLAAARSVDAGAIAREAEFDPARVPKALRSARIAAVDRDLATR